MAVIVREQCLARPLHVTTTTGRVDVNGEMLWTVRACPSYWHGKDKIGDPARDTATEWYEGSMMMENGRVKDGLLQMEVHSVWFCQP